MAIAVDSTAFGNTASGATTLTYAHTCTGSNRVLVVVAWSGLGSGTPTLSATYNAVSMGTASFTGTTGSWRYSVWVMVAPATGANNIVVSQSGGSGVYIYSCSASYTGVNQATPIDVSGTPASFTGQTAVSGSVTTSANNAWPIMAMPLSGGGGSPITAGASTTRRSAVVTAGNGEWVALFDLNAVKTPAGSATMNASLASADGYTVPFSLAPVAVANNSSFFLAAASMM